MKAFRLLALIFPLACAPVLGQDPPAAEAAPAVSPSHLEAAQTLMRQLRLKEFLDQSLDANLEAQVEMNPRLGDYVDILRAFLVKHVGWDAVKDDMTRIYVEAFTEQELRDLIAFYDTPTGQKAVKLLPVLLEKGVSLGQQRFQANVSELQDALAKRQAELAEKEKADQQPEPEKP